ncbi:hypothetical protein [Spirosoma utsteinense]|uniref:hypothetical protein n=1 Tax=Spirosoma utsteinense TaxID=2585773 RepID=UPI001646A954|nr:hypothetical protein [Spirosoma utsteinense]MBC3787758.1 hypothetical protein [Spirosoma utsteinense]
MKGVTTNFYETAKLKQAIVVCLLLLSQGACHHPAVVPTGCGVGNPLTDLPWLKKLVSTPAVLDLSIEQAAYQGQTVFVTYSCDRCFAGPDVAIYRCDGSTICTGLLLYKPTCGSILDSLTDKRELYRVDP